MITLERAVSIVSGEAEEKLMYLRSIVAVECPKIIKALRFIDEEYNRVKEPKGFNLVKRDSKKHRFLYYVRYWYEGKMIPSKWCTHTNEYEAACLFAKKNREVLIAKYFGKNGREVERFFGSFYDSDNPVFKNETIRNIEISEEKRIKYNSIIKNKFIPFLIKKEIRTFDEITVPLLNDFQDYLLLGGIKAQTANDQIVAVKKPLAYLFRKGIIQDDPGYRLTPIPEKAKDKRTHGCYDIEILKGIFDKEWSNNTSCLLNLMIYATGMRNNEIRGFCRRDIISISGCHFIDLKKSKTENGVRLVPLHPMLHERVSARAKNLDEKTAIFGTITHQKFDEAARELGTVLGKGEEYLKENNITFYSGRHAWKTMMNAGGLGEDPEEVFMGHKVSGNVKKLYNHRDKQGQTLMVQKAMEVFAILDQYIFENLKP